MPPVLSVRNWSGSGRGGRGLDDDARRSGVHADVIGGGVGGLSDPLGQLADHEWLVARQLAERYQRGRRPDNAENLLERDVGGGNRRVCPGV